MIATDNATFNVLHEPWIPTRSLAGEVMERGILNTLLHAHELSAIEDASPAIQFGLYRLLIAFVMDAYALKEQEDLEELLNTRAFDQQILEQYLTKCGNCFDLFDAERPFLQVAGDPAEESSTTSIAALFQHIPSGSNVNHFHHGLDADQGASPAVCARGLTAIAPFMTAGGQGKSPSINGAPPWYLLVRGRDLFETIVLNCCALPMPWLIDFGLPCWRALEPVQPKLQVSMFSLLQGLTWQPRTVRLIADENGRCTYGGTQCEVLVRQMQFSAGLRAVIEGGRWVDPNAAYRITEKGRFPMRPSEGRELWRDTGPLTLLQQKDSPGDAKVRFERPLLVSQFAKIHEDGALPIDRPLLIECYGLRTDNMKVFEWQQEQLQIPVDVLRHPKAGVQVQAAMDLAEKIDYVIRESLKKAYPREGKGNDKAFDVLITSVKRIYWDRLRPRFDGEFLALVANQASGDIDADSKLAAQWFKILEVEAWRSLDGTLDDLDGNAQSLRRQVEARDCFYNLMNRCRPGSKDTVGKSTKKAGSKAKVTAKGKS